ncbi:DNA translocase FtsK [Oscillospiraceae bacterium MB08-C2-2]|nr:DNA translocase FtsK [Oscillospiraceae bacterium MB08-C2-2]
MASTTNRKTTKKRAAPSRQTAAQRNAKKQMGAVIMFSAGLLLGALTYIPGESGWFFVHRFIYGMFSWSSFFLAPLLIYIAVMTALDKPIGSLQAKLWQVSVLITLISGAIQIFGPGIPTEENLVENIAALYNGGVSLKGGGLTGAIFGLPLLALCGKTAASIVILLAIFVFTMLITGTTLLHLFRAATRPARILEDVYTAKVEEQEREEPVSAGGRFDINVNLDDDMPAHLVHSSPKAVRRLTPKERLLGVVNVDSPAEHVPAGELESRTQEQEALPEPAAVIPSALEEDIEALTHSEPLHFAQPQEDEEDDLGIDNLIDRYREAPASADPRAPLEQLPWDEPVSFDEPEPLRFPGVRAGGEAIPFPGTKARESRSYEPFTFDQPKEPEPLPNDKDLYKLEHQRVKFSPEELEFAFLEDVKPKVPVVREYAFPSPTLLQEGKPPANEKVSEELKANAQTLVDTLKSFGVQTRITDICRGPAVTRYELQPSAGVKISKITGLADDIALNLAASGIRIEAPIPNKPAVGIEIPNKVVSMVKIREILDSKEFIAAPSKLSAALGRDIAGNIMIANIAKMPHVLIAGSTGSGKSVCINSIIMSLLYKASPDEVKLLMVDPKVVELGVYNGIPHLLVPVVTDPKKAAGALSWAVSEMLNRYKAFAENGVRDLEGYNRLAKASDTMPTMPQIVIIIDELADLMMAAPNEVEDSICRLAQMARAAGMHLVIATQRPSVDIITGVIKANIPSRIAFAVSSQVDSRTILDMGGAEKLLGRGDMLFYPVGAAKPIRVQGCFVTDDEVEKVVSFIKQGQDSDYDQAVAEEIDRHVVVGKASKDKDKDTGGGFEDEDDMLPAAIECVVEVGQASTSLLQRRLKLGYARAARIVDQMEQKGIVGPFEGSKPRAVLISKERWLEMKLSGAEESMMNASRD